MTNCGYDVVPIKSLPLVSSKIPVYGHIYNVKSGSLIEVPETIATGK
jgi:carbonic anhydrase